MTLQVQILPPSGIGGLIQGAFGNYLQATDGSYTVDSRDALVLLGQGFAYVKQGTRSYTLPLAPGAATIGQIVASGALSNGTLSITHQPDTMRPVNFEVGTGTGAITAGTATIVYVGNDGISGTDVFPLACAASGSVTQGLSRGVQTVTSVTIAGLTGGTSPWVRMSTTASVSVPVDPGAIDVNFTREWDAGATIALGTALTTLASITPTTAPNGTVTYSFAYEFVAPNS